MSRLKVYKASAGSGKTFKLTEEYLKLIFWDGNDFQKILAVTFTNKATEEMKNRILGELAKLAHNQHSDFLTILKESFKKDESYIRNQAKNLLENILQNYSRFSIETIDSFFQKIVRSFAKELGVYESINIEIDESPILDEATRILIQDIRNHPDLKDWLMNFVKSRISENKSWKINQEIKNLSRELFKEKFRNLLPSYFDKLKNKKVLGDYVKTLDQIIHLFENKLDSIVSQAKVLLKRNQLEVSDFKGGSNRSIIRHFIRMEDRDYLVRPSVYNAVDQIEEWHSKSSSKKQEIIQAYDAGLNQLLKDSLLIIEKEFKLYNSCILINKFFRTLGVLGDISQLVKTITSTNNTFLLSETTRLLNQMIGDNDAPFIYEKMGSRYKHILIDEFQDTSKVQWENFKPLIENSLSENNHSLVVGDIKQSIYRWRNSDWELLANQIYADFERFGVDTSNLSYNYRSSPNVIEFNNAIFTYIPAILLKHLESLADNESFKQIKQAFKYAYSDLIQKCPDYPKEHEGFIRFSFIEDNEEEKWKDKVLEKLPEIIKELQDQGIEPEDIAFLTRTSSEGNQISNYLLDYKQAHPENNDYCFDIISNDTLYLQGSKSIQLIIAVLTFLHDENDKIALALIHQFLDKTCLNSLPSLISQDDPISSIPEEIQILKQEVSHSSLFDSIEQIISVFKLNSRQGELIFLESFQDWILEISAKRPYDISSFLTYWEDEKDKLKISMPTGQSAMNVSTIHKSKGMEYEVVIIPFCNWDMDHPGNQTNILWSRPDSENLNQIDYVPVKYEKALIDSIFANDYFDEKIRTYIDNLNLLYVTFTRAKEGIIAFAPDNKTQKDTISSLLKEAFVSESKYDQVLDLAPLFNHKNNEFIFGQAVQHALKKERKITPIKHSYPVHELKVKQSYKSEIRELSDKRKEDGNLMHEIFSAIKSAEDINNAVDRFVLGGSLKKEESHRIKTEIRDKLSSQIISAWFTKNKKVLTEKEIIIPYGSTRIPDRVILNEKQTIVIDYKFGEIKSDEYLFQLKNYIKLIKKMGHKSVMGYIWYYHLNELIEISPGSVIHHRL